MNTGNPPHDPESRLTAYILGELSPAEKAEVESRLETDREWQLLLKQLRATIELVSQATPFSDDADKELPRLETGRREKLLAQLTQSPPAKVHVPHRIPWYLPLGIAATLMIGLAYLMLLGTSPRMGSLKTAYLVEPDASSAESDSWGFEQALGRVATPTSELQQELESLRSASNSAPAIPTTPTPKAEANFAKPDSERGIMLAENHNSFSVQLDAAETTTSIEQNDGLQRRGRERLERSLAERAKYKADTKENITLAKRPEARQPLSVSATTPTRGSQVEEYRFARQTPKPSGIERQRALPDGQEERHRIERLNERKKKSQELATDLEVASRPYSTFGIQEPQVSLDQLGDLTPESLPVEPQRAGNAGRFANAVQSQNQALFDTDNGIIEGPRGEMAGGGLGGGGGGGFGGGAAFGGRSLKQAHGLNGRYESLSSASQEIDGDYQSSEAQQPQPTIAAKPALKEDSLDTQLAAIELDFSEEAVRPTLQELSDGFGEAAQMQAGENFLARAEPEATELDSKGLGTAMPDRYGLNPVQNSAPASKLFFYSGIQEKEVAPRQEASKRRSGNEKSGPLEIRAPQLQESLSQFEAKIETVPDVALLAIQPSQSGVDQVAAQLGFQSEEVVEQVTKTTPTLPSLASTIDPMPRETLYKLAAEKPVAGTLSTSKTSEVAQAAFPVEMESRLNPISTFSLNVSDVSFQLSAASLEEGKFPDPSGIRPEEFFNALPYHDAATRSPLPLSIHTERVRYPFGFRQDVLRISVRTKSTGRANTERLNLVVALDNSGSMKRPDRQQILRRTLRSLLDTLRDQDTVSVIAFSRKPRLLADGLTGTSVADLDAILDQIIPEGGTNLEAALSSAYDTARKHFQPTGQNRVILLTDGAANLGDTSSDSLRQIVVQNRKQGIALDCFGIGWDGYEDALLEALTRNGDGRYGFLNNINQVETRFLKQLTGALNVAAKNVKVQIRFNDLRVRAYRQIGFAQHQLKKEDFRNNQVDAAEIAADEAGTALYVLEMLPDGNGPIGEVAIRYQDPQTKEYHELDWPLAYSGQSGAFETASGETQLATIAAVFAERLGGIPYSQSVSYESLARRAEEAAPVPQLDPAVRQLQNMIRQTQQLTGF